MQAQKTRKTRKLRYVGKLDDVTKHVVKQGIEEKQVKCHCLECFV